MLIKNILVEKFHLLAQHGDLCKKFRIIDCHEQTSNTTFYARKIKNWDFIKNASLLNF